MDSDVMYQEEILHCQCGVLTAMVHMDGIKGSGQEPRVGWAHPDESNTSS